MDRGAWRARVRGVAESDATERLTVLLLMHTGGSPVGATLLVENPLANAGDTREAGSRFELGRPPGGGHPTHSSVLAWRIL